MVKPTQAAAGEQRKSPMRREVNEAFWHPSGNFSVSKFITVWAQVMFLFQAGKHFDELIKHSDALWVIATVLVAPELLKKLMAIKGGSAK